MMREPRGISPEISLRAYRHLVVMAMAMAMAVPECGARAQWHALTLPNSSHVSSRRLQFAKLRARRLHAVADNITAERDQRRALKDALAERVEESKGNLDEEAMQLISKLEELNPLTDLNQVPELYKGCFEGLRASFKNTGRKGESQKEVGFSGAIVTLGRATFNVFKPPSLDIKLYETYNHVGHAADGEYSLIIRFQVAEQEEQAPALEGLLINRAKYSISGTKRMDVVFSSSTMRPRFPERDLERWLKVFKCENPGMADKDGSVSANLPAAKGWLDYLYLDEEIRITKGNRGGVSVVRRIEGPVITI